MNLKYLLIASFTSVIQTAGAATLQIEPMNSTAYIGDTITIDIVGTEFPETQGGGFNLYYDANILNVSNVTIDGSSTWNFVNDVGTIDNVNGELNNVNVSHFPGITDNFTVATIEMIAVGAGTSTLNLTESILNPWASNGDTINPTLLNDATLQVVPIPAAAWLFGSALLGLIGLTKKRDEPSFS
jgi:hypothetical protein